MCIEVVFKYKLLNIVKGLLRIIRLSSIKVMNSYFDYTRDVV